MARLMELRSEYYPLAISLDPIGTVSPQRYSNPPLGKRLEKNDLITNEVTRLPAQLTQVCQPVLLDSIPAEWKPVIEAQREIYQGGLELMKPGKTFRALNEFVRVLGTRRKMKMVNQMHGCGYGDDGPRLTAQSPNDRLRDLRIEKGNAFVWKPVAMTADERIQFAWGGPVVVSDSGAEALFKQPHGIVAIE